MKIGHLVAPTKNGKGSLHSGAEVWRVAVVVSVQPFVMVSEGATMKWSAQNAEDFDVVGMAQPGTINLAMTRMPAEDQIRMPVGESFLENQLGNGLTLIHRGLQPAAIDLVEKTPTGIENASYGWVFTWNSDWGRWQALAKPEPEELSAIKERIRDGIVTDLEDNQNIKLRTATRQIADLKGMERFAATLLSGITVGNREIVNPDYKVSMESRGKDTVYWTVHLEDDGVTVQFIPSIQTQLVHSAGMHFLSRTIHSALQGKSPQEVGHDKIDEIVKQWFDDHVARGSIILPNKEKEE